ncbi:unannotated protein [freshwater metagenome]|uniref:Unannotated protein n=1 Tax=freshwater metagenome TaxID=449393 RepID=A0A6J7JYX6_9ZZZZ
MIATSIEGSAKPSAEDYLAAIRGLLGLHRASQSITVGRAKVARLSLMRGLIEVSQNTVK